MKNGIKNYKIIIQLQIKLEILFSKSVLNILL